VEHPRQRVEGREVVHHLRVRGIGTAALLNRNEGRRSVKTCVSMLLALATLFLLDWLRGSNGVITGWILGLFGG
jgi:hypothetical protein